jgi:hypothetical protein
MLCSMASATRLVSRLVFAVLEPLEGLDDPQADMATAQASKALNANTRPRVARIQKSGTLGMGGILVESAPDP